MDFEHETEYLLAKRDDVSVEWSEFLTECVHIWRELATREAVRCVTDWMLTARKTPHLATAWLPKHAIDMIIWELKQAHWEMRASTIVDVIRLYSRFGKIDPRPMLPEWRRVQSTYQRVPVEWAPRVSVFGYEQSYSYPPPDRQGCYMTTRFTGAEMVYTLHMHIPQKSAEEYAEEYRQEKREKRQNLRRMIKESRRKR